MSPDELAARLQRGDPTAILDVRNRDEFEAWHIDGQRVTATQIPAIEFTQADVLGTVSELADQFRDAPKPVVVACGEGRASATVADLLSDAGVEAENLETGMEGWARVYRAREMEHDDATVLQYDRPSSGCLAYMVIVDDEAVVIDPLRTFASRYVEDAREHGAEIVAAVDTHVHADHVSGVRAVSELADAPAVVPVGAVDRGLDFDARLVEDGDTISVGDAELVAVHAPGHTSEMTAYRLGDLRFVGDSLFLESVARPDLEDGDAGAPAAARRLYETLRERYGEFDGGTRIAPGHYSEQAESNDNSVYVATLDALRNQLDALSMDEDEFVSFVLDDMPPRPTNYERIIDTNLGRDSLADDEAFEVELGPNNCAATASD
ncbi:MBL fold metallo-hydrolase [Haloferax mediterranei ATCC 33500]|uniref:Beta-lactamase n=1 Tax=Haloferax mediterranei (strain ATCC 33500 / DSM 1411 / JCM 8866 / NBRC 14739 / NCIMB 2177 / R-4) TaxID=523841 RepID=I3R4U4_HALMT|nr:MBL fold metallo-hydrolase [Haloferax mediterranei]AFK19254.1 Zn-dependent hydrolase, glyoxylase [Haloferax mediterranei ATCC 33500]AHZ21387.1 beta-lactamase [Haloferax mediterranei ATCC 33500]EMA04558.1 Zn-dependent hydrolase [Haloferax mediterranei ATCC 33500]MDX5989356.1 MBL fold metallo-hydrolase [Haloferax mediterranei ATCC 33500]QCQ75721.1 MBL fold metallo-hydrolase [Haloferax mediterranei ATCC 33500]